MGVEIHSGLNSRRRPRAHRAHHRRTILGHSPSTTPSTRKRTHLVTTARRAQQQQQQSTRESTHVPVVVADGPFRNAVLADVVGIRTRTPRHRTKGAASAEEEDVAPWDNAPP